MVEDFVRIKPNEVLECALDDGVAFRIYPNGDVEYAKGLEREDEMREAVERYFPLRMQ